MDYIKKLTAELVEKILAKGVRDMPQNPAAQGYDERQIRSFYYIPEKEILDVIMEIETTLAQVFTDIKDNKVNVSDIIDNLYSAEKTKPLSANMGKELKAQITDQGNWILSLSQKASNAAIKADNALKNSNTAFANSNTALERAERNSEQIQANTTDIEVNKKMIVSAVSKAEKYAQKVDTAITENTNNIKALFNLQLEKNILAYDNAELTEELQQTGGVELDDSTVLDGSYATVNKISGNTVVYRSTNLLNMDAVTTDYGTITKNADKSYTFSGFTDDTRNVPIMNFSNLSNDIVLSEGSYVLKAKVISLGGLSENEDMATDILPIVGNIGQIIDGYWVTNFTLETPYKLNELSVIAAAPDPSAFNGFTISEVQLSKVENSIVPNYEPYYAELKHAQISGIKSTGRNLFNIDLLNGYIEKDPSDENYFRFLVAPSTIPAEKKTIYFDAPQRVRLTYKWKKFEGEFPHPSDTSGVAFAVTDAKGTVKYPQTNLLTDGKFVYALNGGFFEDVVSISFTSNDTWKNTIGDIMISFADTEFEPYIENTMTLPETVELGKWDYIENGQLVKQTIIEQFDSSKYDEENGTYNGTTDFVLSDTQVAYKGTATSTPITFDNKYLVWNKGSEQVLTPTDENGNTCFDYGANTTEENSYYVIVEGNE